MVLSAPYIDPLSVSTFDAAVHSPHLALLGSTGMGKSTVLRERMSRDLDLGIGHLVPDLTGEYVEFARLNGGRVLTSRHGFDPESVLAGGVLDPGGLTVVDFRGVPERSVGYFALRWSLLADWLVEQGGCRYVLVLDDLLMPVLVNAGLSVSMVRLLERARGLGVLLASMDVLDILTVCHVLSRGESFPGLAVLSHMAGMLLFRHGLHEAALVSEYMELGDGAVSAVSGFGRGEALYLDARFPEVDGVNAGVRLVSFERASRVS